MDEPFDEDRYVFRRQTIMVPERIPDDCVKCPRCDGRGMVRHQWSGPDFMDLNPYRDYRRCFACIGSGYIKKTDLEKYQDEMS